MINGKTIKAVIPARMTSNRLPGKVLMPLNGKPALQRIIERVRAAKLLDGVVIATTTNSEDDCIEEFCKTMNCECFRGSENDVLDRIIGAAKKFGADVVCELTSDCPLIFAGHINYLVDLHMQNYPDYDMTTNIETRSFPRGFDLRIVNIEALERSQKEIDNSPDLEHGLTWVYLNPRGKLNYKVQNWTAPPGQNRPDIEVTLDTESDRELLNWIFAAGEECKSDLSCQDVINLIDTFNPDCYLRVQKVERKDYFAELQQCYDNMPKGGIVDHNVAVLHKDTVVPRTMIDKLSGVVNAISGGAKKDNEPKKRGRKPGKKR